MPDNKVVQNNTETFQPEKARRALSCVNINGLTKDFRFFRKNCWGGNPNLRYSRLFSETHGFVYRQHANRQSSKNLNISYRIERTVGVETPTYGIRDYFPRRTASFARYIPSFMISHGETPVPTCYTRQRLETIAKTEFLRTMPAPFSNLRKKKGSRLPV